MTQTMRAVRRPAASSERALVRSAQKGDARAFEALIELHDRALRGLAFRLLEDRFAMQDVMQEAYVSAYRAIGSFSGGSAIGTWLYRIVYNACMDELRRRPRRAHANLDDALQHADPAPGPDEAVAARSDLAVALAALAPEHRAVVLLVDAEGLSYGEAAQALGTTVATVTSRLHRARAALRPVLAADTSQEDQR